MFYNYFRSHSPISPLEVSSTLFLLIKLKVIFLLRIEAAFQFRTLLQTWKIKFLLAYFTEQHWRICMYMSLLISVMLNARTEAIMLYLWPIQSIWQETSSHLSTRPYEINHLCFIKNEINHQKGIRGLSIIHSFIHSQCIKFWVSGTVQDAGGSRTNMVFSGTL